MGASKLISLVQYVCIRKKCWEKFLAALLIMIREYRTREVFNAINIGTEKAFESIKSRVKDKPHQVTLTTRDTDRHVEVIERMIRFAREKSVLYNYQNHAKQS